jgi:8-oxo-dGTP diphosphatase
VHGDGNAWTTCGHGHRHWGRHGAAGLLIRRVRGSGGPEFLLQHRAGWSHHGDTWGLPGGARDSDEEPVHAALREAAEEAGVDPAAVRVTGELDDDHGGGWSYVSVLASPAGQLDPRPTGLETTDVRWVAADDVARLPLHPGFAATWPLLAGVDPVTVVIDAANVVGSRPDGWWRDREGAARRLLSRVESLARVGLAPGDLPGSPAGLSRVVPRLVLVVEGRAAPIADEPRTDGAVELVAADGSGDDAIVDAVAAARTDRPQLFVVTADRGLRDRVTALGADSVGPRWLLDLLDAADDGAEVPSAGRTP